VAAASARSQRQKGTTLGSEAHPGNTTLLIHGARSVILMAKRQTENKNVWLANLLNRRHPNIAAVALANKNVRTVWALLAHGRDFKPDYVPVRATA
jgi:transposase